IISLVDLPANFILIAFSFISAGYITLVLIETPPLVSFYMNPTKVFLSYSHFLVAVPYVEVFFFTKLYKSSKIRRQKNE
ncbi:hypothetical protein, partial [Listeria monocytogenes]|uniref:hypothetical protein n=1 Tax=Listeria monocytogenes TaxID=1639 RepID=UPI001F240230